MNTMAKDIFTPRKGGQFLIRPEGSEGAGLVVAFGVTFGQDAVALAPVDGPPESCWTLSKEAALELALLIQAGFRGDEFELAT